MVSGGGGELRYCLRDQRQENCEGKTKGMHAIFTLVICELRSQTSFPTGNIKNIQSSLDDDNLFVQRGKSDILYTFTDDCDELHEAYTWTEWR